MNELAGLRLRYLLGAEKPGNGIPGFITMVSWDWNTPVAEGTSAAYCNLFYELYEDDPHREVFGPYLPQNAVARQYQEGQIDPRGKGWEKNLRAQFERRRKSGFSYVELDNPDAYAEEFFEHVLGAVSLAREYGLRVIAKNPPLLEKHALAFLEHPNVFAAIVEQDAGTPAVMHALRREARKPEMPVWFVAFGKGREWANATARAARAFTNMHVSFSSEGEYGNSIAV